MTDWSVIIQPMARLAPARRAALESERREQILDAALRLWTKHGFDATTVDALAREAGVAKGTVYLYFDTKEAVFAAAAERWSLLPDLAALGPTFGDAPLAEALPRLAEQLWRRLRRAGPVVGLLLRELALRPAEARRFLEAVVLPANGAFAAFLEDRIRAGEVRALDPLVATRAFVGMLMIFLWTQHVLGGDAIRPIRDGAVVDTASSIFLRGVLAPEGARRSGPRRPRGAPARRGKAARRPR
jgi:AcrR family transcriptional regulator